MLEERRRRKRRREESQQEGFLYSMKRMGDAGVDDQALHSEVVVGRLLSLSLPFSLRP
tara:strand:- start:5 stop:178 length:174 start_codon:yes stop_codon:yes gene_type:complete